ncbi:response regulator transcription factor [Tateyamaria sp. ANG-S1]|uniref:winged helix-turn-helix domain-containing protein n=1 Tax=Tateyamaria sp. ANG-S1 TaxID=1577905 RepID=UPI0006904B28|nr:response regulator transcription factor [Tateyamaria sp. ANG-S1]
MNVLFVGPDELFSRVVSQAVGQDWELHRAQSVNDMLDYQGTHCFHAALFGMCDNALKMAHAARVAKNELSTPITIGLVPRSLADGSASSVAAYTDAFIVDCGDDRLAKLQCDAILRIANGLIAQNVTCGDVTFHTSGNAFSVNGELLNLTRRQYQVLELLFLGAGKTITADMVFNHIYGWQDTPSTKVIDVWVCQLRRKLREAGSTSNCIQTVWGEGYALRVQSISGKPKAA